MFDWQSEAEEEWETLEPAPPPPQPRRRPWLTIGIVIAVLALAGFVLTQQVTSRVNAATDRVVADVRSSVALVEEAVAQGDLELLRVLLSGRDPAWTVRMIDLFLNGAYVERRPLDWVYLSQGAEVVDVSLSPDLSEAVVTLARAYRVPAPDGRAQEIVLHQEQVYRRGSDRWLLAPQLPAYWQEQAVYQGERLRLVYPGRDADVAERLAQDLEILVGRFCTELADVTCAPSYRASLTLDTELGSFLLFDDTLYRYRRRRALRAPTPSLLGRPTDEVSYQALYRLYGIYLISREMLEQSGYRCCQHVGLYDALLDRQLAQLGLAPPPLVGTPFKGFAAEFATLRDTVQDLYFIWFTLPGEAEGTPLYQNVHLVLDFVQAQSGVSELAMQRQLQRGVSYVRWWELALPPGKLLGDAELEEAWRQFVTDRARLEQREALLLDKVEG